MENRHDIISRINEKYTSMSKGHKAIASYIMEHYDQAAFMTAAKLGEALGISESTVVRFASGIGYEGYPQMQQALAAWVKGKLNTIDSMDVKYAGSSQSEVLASVLSSDIEKLRLLSHRGRTLAAVQSSSFFIQIHMESIKLLTADFFKKGGIFYGTSFYY